MNNMNKTLSLVAALSLAIASMTVNAENRVSVGYTNNKHTSNAWAVDAEKDMFTVAPRAMIYVDGAVNQPVGHDGATYSVGAGVQYTLNDNFLAKVGTDYNRVESAGHYNTYRASLVYQNAGVRVSGSVVKPESRKTYAEVTAEYAVWKNVSVGLGSAFDNDRYRSTRVYVSYTF